MNIRYISVIFADLAINVLQILFTGPFHFPVGLFLVSYLAAGFYIADFLSGF